MSDETPTPEREASPAATVTTHSSPALERWVDEVPRPGVVDPTGEKDGQPYYEIEMSEIEHQLHRDLPPTTVWGYDGQFPGPTIEARQGEPISVRWQNKLPDEHLLPVDTTIHSDIIPYETPGVRTVTHLHGGNIESESDGKSQAWYTRDFAATGPEFEQKDYHYVNDQPAATLWYHDHALGITRLNVYAGLAGFYLLRSDEEDALELPRGEYEVPLVLQDRSFSDDGSLFYPTAIADEQSGRGDSHPEPSIVPEFYGDTSVVNGKAWPRLSVGPTSYRFRLLNGSNSRYYNLTLLEYDESTGETGDEGPAFAQIGNDGGLLAEPVPVDDRLEIGSGQRADVVVDFSEYAGETLLLHNDAPALYRGDQSSADDDIVPLHEILLVDVADGADAGGEASEAGAEEATENLPNELTRVPDITLEDVDTKRYLTLTADQDEHGRMVHLLGTEDEPDGLAVDDPVTEEPTVGDTELWSFANLTDMSHPMHLHLVHFQLLGRQPLGEYQSTEDEIDLDALESPKAYEQGWNDVITVHPAEVVHILVHFGEYEGVFNDQTGTYMWHCHMVEHEDYDMMRPFAVRPASESEEDPASEAQGETETRVASESD
ncbi:Bilirubin oxidase [Natrialba sp. SSL1]|nr:Bilirubin oxidase [Natrialba sp. SSL1]